MRRAYRNGLLVALHRWPLAGVLFLFSLFGAGAFMGCAWIGLAVVLDASLATRTLLTSLDIDVFIDIFIHHRSELVALAVTGIVLAVGLSLLWIWVNAAVASAVTTERRPLATSFVGGAARYWTFLIMWLLAMTAHVVVVIVSYVGWRLIGFSTAESTNEMTPYWAMAACIIGAAPVLLLVTTIHDHARIRCVETADGAGRCMAWAVAYVLRQPRAVGLTVLLVVTLGVAWMPYQAVSELIPATSALGVAASLIWAEMFMALRALLRVWAFAAVAALQSGSEEP
jgi:hypothetical protein